MPKSKLLIAAAGICFAMAPLASAADIAVSKHVIAEEPDPEKSENNAQLLIGGLHARPIYVDWRIVTDGESESCEKTLAESKTAGSFQFSPYGYVHALVVVVIPAKDRAPLFEMNCQYRTDPAVGHDLRHRGLFYVLKTEIPTADSFELRALDAGTADIAALARVGAF
jgi:hypothetical protein